MAEEEVVEEYESSLAELTFNSKPQINMLTMLAEDHEQHASHIVKVIEDRIEKMESKKKLPLLYLIDSVIKNLQTTNYPRLFSQNIVTTFSGVFEKVDEKTRQALYKLRQTWSRLFPDDVLYALDVKICTVDPAWPVTAPAPPQSPVGNIHVNPRFLKHSDEDGSGEAAFSPTDDSPPDLSPKDEEKEMRKQLLAKQQELLRLQTQRLELELAETKAKLQQQENAFGVQPVLPPIPVSTDIETCKHSNPASAASQSNVSTESVKTAGRDPRIASRDPRLANRDPRMRTKQHKKADTPTTTVDNSGPHTNIFTAIENMKNSAPLTPNLPFPFPVFNQQETPAEENQDSPGMASTQPTETTKLQPAQMGLSGPMGVLSGGMVVPPIPIDHTPGGMMWPHGPMLLSGQPPRQMDQFQPLRPMVPPPRQMGPRLLVPPGLMRSLPVNQMRPYGGLINELPRQMVPFGCPMNEPPRQMGPSDALVGPVHGQIPQQIASGVQMVGPNMPYPPMVPSTVTGVSAGQPISGAMPPFGAQTLSLDKQNPEKLSQKYKSEPIGKKDQKTGSNSNTKIHSSSKKAFGNESKNKSPSKRNSSPRSNSSAGSNRSNHSDHKSRDSSKSKLSDDTSRKNRSSETVGKKIDKNKKDYSKSRSSDRRHRDDTKGNRRGSRSVHGSSGENPDGKATNSRDRSPVKRDRHGDRHRPARDDRRTRSEKKSIDDKHDKKKSEILVHNKKTASAQIGNDQKETGEKLDENKQNNTLIKPFGHSDDVDDRKLPDLMDIDERSRPSSISNEESVGLRDVDIRVSQKEVLPIQIKLEDTISQKSIDSIAIAASSPKPLEPKIEAGHDQPVLETDINSLKEKQKAQVPVDRAPVKRDLEDAVAEDQNSKKPRVEVLNVKVSPNKIADDLSDLFGQEDQDYRRVSGEHPSLPSLKSPGQAGWMRLKSITPDEPAVEEHSNVMEMDDVDHRIPQDVDMRRLPPSRKIVNDDVEDVHIPRALSMQMRLEILNKAESQRKSGELSHEEHQQLLRQLSSIDSLQKQHKVVQDSQNWQVRPGRQGSRSPLLEVPREYQPRQFRKNQPLDQLPPSENGPLPLMNLTFSCNIAKNFDIKSLEEEGDNHRNSPFRDLDERMPDSGDRVRSPHKIRNEMDSRTGRISPSPNYPPNDFLPSRKDDMQNMNINNQFGRASPEMQFSPNQQHGVLREGPMAVQENLFPPKLQMNQPLNTNIPFSHSQQNSVNNEDSMTVAVRLNDSRWNQLESNRERQLSEEVVIDRRPYEIKVGVKPRIIKVYRQEFELYADPVHRAVLVNGQIVYKFGEIAKDVRFGNRFCKLFYHGRPQQIWIDNQQYEVRTDAPPRSVEINGKDHTIQIDGRDMMILIDREEKGPCGGQPRFIFLDNIRMQLRFEPPPRQIRIDGKLCELKLNGEIPFIVFDSKPRGIRFDGTAKEVVIDDRPYSVPADKSIRVRIGNRFHNLALGGPAHELIIDGKWYEVKFNGRPKEITLGNRTHVVRLVGDPPDVKILGELPKEIVSDDLMSSPSAGHGPPLPGPINMPLPTNMLSGPLPFRPQLTTAGQIPRIAPPNQMQMQMPRPLGLPDPRMSLIPIPPGHGMSMPPRHGMPFNQPGMPNQPPMLLTGQNFRPGIGPNLPPVVNFGPSSQPLMLVGQPGPVGMGPGMMPGNQNFPNQVVGGMPGAMPLQPNGGVQQSGGHGDVPVSEAGLRGAVGSMPAPSAIGQIDVNSLFQKLVFAGIIQKTEPPKESETEKKEEPQTFNIAKKEKEEKNVKKEEEDEEEEIEEVPDISDFDLSALKIQYKGVIQKLYTGIQCQTCGMRFATFNTDKYREHLDWHFRQNRREKDELRITRFRRWYYDADEWVQFEEVQDEEEKARSNFFETSEAKNKSQERVFTLPEGTDYIKCPPATGDDDDVCDICSDPFEQYWSEDHEEWHLRNAIRVNGKTYHPVCFEDAKENSVLEPSPTPTTSPEANPLVSQLQDTASAEEMETASQRTTPVQDEEPSPNLLPVIWTSQSDTEETNTPEKVQGFIKTEPMDTLPVIQMPIPIKLEPIPQTSIKLEPKEILPISETSIKLEPIPQTSITLEPKEILPISETSIKLEPTETSPFLQTGVALSPKEVSPLPQTSLDSVSKEVSGISTEISTTSLSTVTSSPV